jgi:UDP-N-acetylmuramoylalanine--D-glutamate ligase
MSWTILLYGKWKVGQSLARFCTKMEIDFVLCDESDAPESFESFSHLIPSPGIPSSHRIYESDKVISELDFLARYIPKWFQIHAVTGTDGKSTTSWVLFHFLQAGLPEIPAYLGGNFWTALADILLEIDDKWQKEGNIVLEVSSFMAYHIRTFYAHNTILTNLHPDHLDWHKDLSEYYNAKLNLLGHTKNLILYPALTVALLPDLPHFPIDSIVMPEQCIIDHGLLTLTPEALIDISERQLLGEHNVVNIFLAASLALRLGVWAKMLSTILPSIPALPHRLQQISDHDGKIWIDDSKSTTAQSLYAALRAFAPKKVHLIAGWKDKGDTFDWLVDALREHCEQCVAIGETKSIFLQACHDAFVSATSVASMEEAVQIISESTTEGDIILLSPGCSSFDMFQNYEDRAAHFARAINASE